MYVLVLVSPLKSYPHDGDLISAHNKSLVLYRNTAKIKFLSGKLHLLISKTLLRPPIFSVLHRWKLSVSSHLLRGGTAFTLTTNSIIPKAFVILVVKHRPVPYLVKFRILCRNRVTGMFLYQEGLQPGQNAIIRPHPEAWYPEGSRDGSSFSWLSKALFHPTKFLCCKSGSFQGIALKLLIFFIFHTVDHELSSLSSYMP